jgi:hypothetical protein
MIDPPTLAANLLANFRTIRLPPSKPDGRGTGDCSGQVIQSPPDWMTIAKARRADDRAAEACRDRIRRALVEHGHHQFLHYLEPDPAGGWRLHLFVADDHALLLVDEFTDARIVAGAPASFDPEEFVMQRLGRLVWPDSDSE